MRFGILMSVWIAICPPAQAGERPKDKVQLKEVTIWGLVSKELFQRCEERHHKDLVECYEKALIKSPNLTGTLTMEIVVSSTGRVTTVSKIEPESTLEDATMDNCIKRDIEEWVVHSGIAGGICRFKARWVFG